MIEKRKEHLLILAIYLTSRFSCAFFVYLGHIKRPYMERISGGWEGVNNWWLNPWTTYDSLHYLSIASSGYESHTTAFFPLYPTLLKLFGPELISMALAGTIMSHLFFLIAIYLIFYLTKQEQNQKIAFITIGVICFFPSAAFFGAVYTESLFLLLSAGTFWAVRNRYWGRCSLLAAAAALTRNPGVIIAAALFLEVIFCESVSKKIRHKWFVVAAPLIAFVSVQLFFWLKFGDPASGIVSQQYYGREIMWPWQTILLDINALLYNFRGFVGLFFTSTSLIITFLSLFFIIYAYKKIPTSYIILISGITLMNLIYARVEIPSTISGIRYMGALFPFSQLLGIIYFKLHQYRILGPTLVAIQAFAFIVYSYYYGLKVVF